jgi:hypothetical protein
MQFITGLGRAAIFGKYICHTAVGRKEKGGGRHARARFPNSNLRLSSLLGPS